MSENHEGEPEVFPAELVEIVPAAAWQFQQMPPQPQVRQRRIRLPLLLFIATCLSTLMAGIDECDMAQLSWMAGIYSWTGICRAADDHFGLS